MIKYWIKAIFFYQAPLLDHHLKVMTELVSRDKNHPSVVMWSVGNEPKSYRNASGEKVTFNLCTQMYISGEYFKSVADHTRQLDATRPVTLVCNAQWDQVTILFNTFTINTCSIYCHANLAIRLLSGTGG